MRVIHLVRSIGPTSMPWNDLYAISRHLAPGGIYPPLEVGKRYCRTKVRRASCRNHQRRYISGNPLGLLIYIWKIYKKCQSRENVLILHVHNPMLSILGFFAKTLCPKIIVVGSLHTDWRYLAIRHTLGLRLLARISDKFICVSKSSLESIPKAIRNSLLNHGRVSVIYNGIDIEGMNKIRPNTDMTPSSGGRTAIIVARMVPAKNCMYPLHLIKEIDSIDQIIWYGDGPLREEIEKEIYRLKIGSRVILLGNRPRSEVFSGLSKATIYISASKWEGIGVANLEAAALGCWPFLSKIEAHDEIAEILGISTYRLDNMNAWIDGIKRFLDLSSDHRSEMRQALSEKACKNFDLNVTVQKYIDVYKKLSTKSYG